MDEVKCNFFFITRYRGWLMKINEWYKEHFLELKLQDMRKFN